MARNFILISGGPGLFDALDPEAHDHSWSNYVDCPLLLSKDNTAPLLPVASDEEVFWFVFEPAFVERWNSDVQRTDLAGKDAVKKVRDAGFTSYTDLITQRADDRQWKLRWLQKADDLWAKLATFNDPISRVYYWGHAADSLWLSLEHDSQSHEGKKPSSDRVLSEADIEANKALQARFQSGDASRIHRFLGCNTKSFAKKWSEVFKVHAEGIDGKIDFSSIHSTGGEPSLAASASQVFFT